MTRSVYPSDDRRAAGSTTAVQIVFLRAIARSYEPITASFAPGGVWLAARSSSTAPSLGPEAERIVRLIVRLRERLDVQAPPAHGPSIALTACAVSRRSW